MFSVGESIQLRVWVQDVRTEPLGVLSAYLDAEFETSLLSVVPDSFAHGPSFGDVGRVNLSTPGFIDDAGSFAAGHLGIPPLPEPLGGDEYLLWSVELSGIVDGNTRITSNPADVLPLHATTLIGTNAGVAADEMEFGSTLVTIVPEPSGQALASFVFAFAWLRSRRNRQSMRGLLPTFNSN